VCIGGSPPGRRRADAVAAAVVTLVLGGARSGKSEFAERLARRLGEPVRYVATGAADGDPDWTERIVRHKERRPDGWQTIDLGLGGDLAAAIEIDGPVLVDSLGTWVAGLEGFGEPVGASTPTERLLEALDRRRAGGDVTILVSDEVGGGVHPPTAVGRAFRDALGRLNALVSATVADDVFLVVAGRVLRLGEPIGVWGGSS
jgi:adenosylcobinamide kinase / adenosylcobinamide-phosphate guanylyltransferase